MISYIARVIVGGEGTESRISVTPLWLFNPVFLSAEIIAIDVISHIFFEITSVSILTGFILVLFAIIYNLMGFSSINSSQSILIALAGISEFALASSGLVVDRTAISLTLVSLQISLALYYVKSTSISLEGENLRIQRFNKVHSWNVRDSSVEVRVRSIGVLLGYGDLNFRKDNHLVRVSGITNPIGSRRELIDKHAMAPYHQKAPWLGSLPFFLIVLTSLFSIEALFFCFLKELIFYKMDGPIGAFSTIFIFVLANLLLLNLRISRYSKDPAADLRERGIIARGAWTEIFPQDEENVVKQLFRCGWGHNDYSMHRSPVIGSKICGPRNPLALVVMHNLMLMYQMVGIERRRIYYDSIEAIPWTGIPGRERFRYSQELVPISLDDSTLPEDYKKQFEKLNSQLRECGLNLDDIHAGNVRLSQNGRIRIVDGELYTDGEVLIKTILVRIFDGRRVTGMEPVLGLDRIIRWVDQRTSVDEIANIGKSPSPE